MEHLIDATKSINKIEENDLFNEKEPQPSLMGSTTDMKIDMLANQNKLKIEIINSDIDENIVISNNSTPISRRSNKSPLVSPLVTPLVSPRFSPEQRTTHKPTQQPTQQQYLSPKQTPKQTQIPKPLPTISPKNIISPKSKQTNKTTNKTTNNTTNNTTNKPTNPKEVRYRKIELLRIFKELKEKGVNITDYTINSDIDEMEEEYDLLRSIETKKNSVQFYKNILVNVIYGVELLNDNYNPFDFELKGWGQSVGSNINDYEEVLGELYEKYKNTGKKIEPELKLILMLIGSATIYHATKSFEKEFMKSTTNNEFDFGGLNLGNLSSILGKALNPTPNKVVIQEEEQPIPSNYYDNMSGSKPAEFIKNLSTRKKTTNNDQPTMKPPSFINTSNVEVVSITSNEHLSNEHQSQNTETIERKKRGGKMQTKISLGI